MDSGSGGAPQAGRQVAFEAPIVAVAVYPSSARVTRRGTVHVTGADPTAAGPAAAGPTGTGPTGTDASGTGIATVEVVLGELPRRTDVNSVRVTGRGAVRVHGVDVRDDIKAAPTGDAVAALEADRDALRRRLAELADADDAQRARRGFLDVVARAGAAALARSMAADQAADPALSAGRLAAVSGLLVGEIGDVHSHRRTIADEREETERQLAAVERTIAARRTPSHPDTRKVVVALEPLDASGGPVDVELDVSYVVPDAGWTSVYDARLDGDKLTLTWFGLITQRTGEDWPMCELTLSTARPATGARLPELDPWYVGSADVVHRGLAGGASEAGGPLPAAPPMALMAAAPGGAARSRLAQVPEVEDVTADLDASGAASSYRLARPVPVPADGTPHRATVAAPRLDVALDYLTAPKLAPEAHLRATVTNSTDHTFRPGKVSIFHGQEFVGTSRLDSVPPGAEFELHLGIDDRLAVERELVRRNTGKRVVGNMRRTDVAYRVTLANHTGRAARVTLNDQFPVPANADVVVRDEQATPNPDERSELGILTWTLELKPDEERHVDFAFRIEHPRGLHVSGI